MEKRFTSIKPLSYCLRTVVWSMVAMLFWQTTSAQCTLTSNEGNTTFPTAFTCSQQGPIGGCTQTASGLGIGSGAFRYYQFPSTLSAATYIDIYCQTNCTGTANNANCASYSYWTTGDVGPNTNCLNTWGTSLAPSGANYVRVSTTQGGAWNGYSSVIYYRYSTPGTPAFSAGPTLVCTGASGQTYTVGATANTTSYTWTTSTASGTATAAINSGQGSTSISVSFSGSGSVNIICTPQNGVAGSCGISASRTVTVDAAPVAGTYAYSTLYECDGYTRNASGTIVTNSVSGYTGGTPAWYWGTSGGAVNSWGSGNSAPGNNCFPYQHASTDADRMWVVIPSANGACTAVTMPQVLVVPTGPAISNVTAAANPVCGQGTTTLTANSISGLAPTVTWYSGSGASGNNLGTGTTLTAGGGQTFYARVTDVCNATTQCSGTKSTAAEANLTVNLESTAPTTNAPAAVSVNTSPNNTCKAAGVFSNGTVSDACATGASAGINVLPASGLVLWTRADAGVVKDASGNVSQWSDLSGNGNHFKQSNFSYRPTLTTSNSNFNNNPSLTFTTSQFLTNITNIGSSATGTYTMFTVSRLNGGTNSRLISSASTNWLLGYWGGYQNQHYANNWISNPAASPNTSAHMYSVTSTGSGASGTTFYDYGNVIATGTAGGPNQPGVIQLNGWNNGLSEMSSGEIAEVIYYNRVLSAAERQIVEGYLAYKYNMQAPLASMQAFQTYAAGSSTVNFRGADAAGNTSSATQTFTGVTYPGPSVSASSTSVCATSTVTLSVTGMAPAGQSANCANSTDYVNVSSVPIGSNWTIMGWVKFPLPNTGGAGNWNTLVRGTSYHHIICNNDGTNKYLGSYVGGFQSSGFNVNQLSAGWHHIAAVGSGGGTGFYVDGVFVGRSASQATDNIVAIGNYQGGGQQFGQFDEMSIWNTTLSQNTISDWMTRGLTASHPNWANLVAYYKLDNNGTDSKAGTYPATLSGAATWGTNSAFYTYTWSGPGGTYSNNNNTAESTVVTSPASGTYSVYPAANGCNGTSSNAPAITVYQLPVVSGSTSVCENASSVAYTNSVGSTNWSVSPGSLGSITSGGLFTPSAISAPTQSASGNIVVVNGACTANYAIQVYNMPTLSSPPAAVCDNSSVALNADLTVSWSASAGGMSPASGTSSTLTPPSLSSPTLNQNVTVTYTNGACSATQVVRTDNAATFTTAPTAMCDAAGNTSDFNVDLGDGNVTWSQNMAGGSVSSTGVFDPADIAQPTTNTNVTVTATNGVCNSTAVIRVDNDPTAANAGVDINQCNTSTFTMAGNTPGVTGATSVWACQSGCTGVGITNSNSPTTTVTTVPFGTTTLRWTHTNQTCSSYDDVNLNNYQQATVSGNTSVCDDLTNVLYNNNVGSTSWSVSPGSLGSITSGGYFTPANISTPTQSATGAIVLTNGACVTNYNINVYNKPTITSSSASLCEGETRILTSDVNGTTFSGTGVSFVNPNWVFTAPNPGGTSANYFITATNSSGCQDQQVLTVYKSATITSSAADMCEGSTRALIASVNPGVWSASCGGCVSGSTFTAPTPAGNSATYTITYYVIGSSCTAPTQNITVYAQPTLSVPASVCDNSTATLSSTKAVTWSAASGSFSPTTGTSSTYTPSAITNPTANTTITITGTNGACSANGNIQVDNAPALTTAPTTACDNTTASIVADISVSWSASSGSVSPSTGSSTVLTPPALSSPTLNQNVTVTYTNGSCTATQVVRTDNEPVFTLAPTTMCDAAGTTANFNVDLGDGNVTWSQNMAGGNISAAGVLDPADIAVPTANANVTVTATNGVCAPTQVIRVDNVYTITSSAADMCEGDTRTLTADVSGGSFTGDCGACVSGITFTAPTPPGNSANSTITYLISGNVCGSAKQDILVWHAPSTANAGIDVSTSCGSAISMAGTSPTFGTGTWIQIAGGGTSTFANTHSATTSVSATTGGVYTYRWTVANGVCPSSTDDADADYVSGVTATPLVDACMNSAGTDNYYVLLTAAGGTGPYTFSGSPVSNLSGTERIYEQAAGATTSYTVTDNLGCSGSASATAPTGHPTDIPYAGTTGSVTVDCYQKNFNKWVTYRDGNNDAILSLQDNNQDLGTVTVTVYRDGAEPVAFSNDSASTCTGFDDLKAMKRHFRVTSSAAQPFASNVGVRLYFSNAELSSLITASTGNNVSGDICTGNDDVTSINDLYVTKYSGNFEDNDYNNNDAAGIYKVYGDNNAYNTTDGALTKSSGGFSTLFNGGQSHHYVELNVDRFSEFWLHGSQPAQALPVEMIYFEANAIDNSYIQLKWATAIEINNDGFWVERSTDGVNFNAIAWVDGHDNSTVTNTYSYNDMNVVAGTRYYYRLKQMDNDGQFEYTAIVSAIIAGDVTFEVLDFIPNPTSGQTNLFITSSTLQEVNIELYNIIGERIMDRVAGLNKGGNVVPFDFNLLAAGTYTAVVHTGNEVHSRKVVITK